MTLEEAFTRRAEFRGLEQFKTFSQFCRALKDSGMPPEMLKHTKIGPTVEGMLQGDYSESE